MPIFNGDFKGNNHMPFFKPVTFKPFTLQELIDSPTEDSPVQQALKGFLQSTEQSQYLKLAVAAVYNAIDFRIAIEMNGQNEAPLSYFASIGLDDLRGEIRRTLDWENNNPNIMDTKIVDQLKRMAEALNAAIEDVNTRHDWFLPICEAFASAAKVLINVGIKKGIVESKALVEFTAEVTDFLMAEPNEGHHRQSL